MIHKSRSGGAIPVRKRVSKYHVSKYHACLQKFTSFGWASQTMQYCPNIFYINGSCQTAQRFPLSAFWCGSVRFTRERAHHKIDMHFVFLIFTFLACKVKFKMYLRDHSSIRLPIFLHKVKVNSPRSGELILLKEKMPWFFCLRR